MYLINPKSTVSKSLYVDEVADGWVDESAWGDYPLLSRLFCSIVGAFRLQSSLSVQLFRAMMRQITSGDYDVTAYHGYDNVQGAHYFQSTINGAINRTVSRLDAKGKLTTIGEAEGSSSAIFSPDMAFYTMSYSNITTPPAYTLNSSKARHAESA